MCSLQVLELLSAVQSQAPSYASLRAVVYFDPNPKSASGGAWVVRERSGSVTPKLTSPIPECDSFVIFGERHCRGADMKLRRDASAVLTLGPRMRKDAFMQAAGRLRKLGKGQTISVVALPDVHDSICQLMRVRQNTETET